MLLICPECSVGQKFGVTQRGLRPGPQGRAAGNAHRESISLDWLDRIYTDYCVKLSLAKDDTVMSVNCRWLQDVVMKKDDIRNSTHDKFRSNQWNKSSYFRVKLKKIKFELCIEPDLDQS